MGQKNVQIVMKRVYLFLIQALMALSLVVAVGCSKNDSPDEPDITPPVVDPNIPVKDPEGTITANISTSTQIDVPNFGTIKWTGPDNFYLICKADNYRVSISNMGTMQGLGNITGIPQAGYTTPANSNTTVACEGGKGYVVKFDNGSSVLYVRLYVVESIISTSGGVMGAKVTYQFPFEPTTLTVSKDALSFTKDAGTQTVTVTTDATGWSYTCDASWITVTKSNNTLSVAVPANTGLLRSGTITIQANEKRKVITVEQAIGMASTSAPYAIGNPYNVNGVVGIVYKINTDGTHGMIVSVTETSCAWSTASDVTGCSDQSNGMNNMTIIKNIASWENKYPAFKWCNDFNTGSITGWYLPARDELYDLFQNVTTVNTTLTKYGCIQIVSDYYWSSSEYGSSSAYSRGGSYSYLSKGTICRVRAVRAF